MEILSYDLSALFTMANAFAILAGLLFGICIGTMPGLGPTVGVALILPATYTMDILPAILLLTALYQGAEYGGSISAIILGIPGTASAAATILDGNSMARKGYPGKALAYSLYASVFGGFFSGLGMLFFISPLTKVAIHFSDPEIFLIAVLGLVSVVGLASKDILKSLISVLLGLLLSTVGMDVFTGVFRFTMEISSLSDGIPFVALITGLFAFLEVINFSSENLAESYVTDTRNLKVKVSLGEFGRVRKSLVKGSIIGFIMGVIPGLGPSSAAWLAYTEVKRTSKHPERFGTGEPEGIVACESSNNACVGGALLPLLSLGIPGSGTIAVISTAFIIKGIQPGPQVFQNQGDLVYGIIWGFLLTAVALFFVGRHMTALFARMLTIPNYMLLVVIFMATVVGAYGIRFNIFDIGLALAAGVLGFFASKLDYSIPCFIMSFILGPLIEISLRRSLMLSRGSYLIFFSRGYSLVLSVALVLLIFMMAKNKLKTFRN